MVGNIGLQLTLHKFMQFMVFVVATMGKEGQRRICNSVDCKIIKQARTTPRKPKFTN